MIVDTSALAAIFFEEEDAPRYLDAIERSEATALSSVTFLEIGIVLARRFVPDRTADLAEFLEDAGVEISPFTPAQAKRALQAYRTYGRAFHSAGLNFGDCAAYALAMERQEPLLFKGNDFSQTDVACVLV